MFQDVYGRPIPSSPEALRRTQRQRRAGTRPELKLRRELHPRRLRYRVDTQVLPGLRRRADLVLPRQRVAVFVDGCFWRVCPEHGTSPKSNAAWWRQKLQANVERDRDTDRRLEKAEWTPVRIWEHDGPVRAADLVEQQQRR